MESNQYDKPVFSISSFECNWDGYPQTPEHTNQSSPARAIGDTNLSSLSLLSEAATHSLEIQNAIGAMDLDFQAQETRFSYPALGHLKPCHEHFVSRIRDMFPTVDHTFEQISHAYNQSKAQSSIVKVGVSCLD